jgi:hypothetical protein
MTQRERNADLLTEIAALRERVAALAREKTMASLIRDTSPLMTASHYVTTS